MVTFYLIHLGNYFNDVVGEKILFDIKIRVSLRETIKKKSIKMKKKIN